VRHQDATTPNSTVTAAIAAAFCSWLALKGLAAVPPLLRQPACLPNGHQAGTHAWLVWMSLPAPFISLRRAALPRITPDDKPLLRAITHTPQQQRAGLLHIVVQHTRAETIGVTAQRSAGARGVTILCVCARAHTVRLNSITPTSCHGRTTPRLGGAMLMAGS
jgi:hypothetical protein